MEAAVNQRVGLFRPILGLLPAYSTPIRLLFQVLLALSVQTNSGEPEREAVVAKNATVQRGPDREVARDMVTESKPAQKDLMIRLILNLLGNDPS